MRLALQLVIGAVAAVALITGTLAMVTGIADPFFGIDPIARPSGVVQLDSLFRYYDGLWLGLGLVLLPVAWRVERHAALLQAAAVLVFVGAIGRVISMVQHGLPHPGFVAATAAELLFPLLVPWQRALAGRSEDSGAEAARRSA